MRRTDCAQTLSDLPGEPLDADRLEIHYDGPQIGRLLGALTIRCRVGEDAQEAERVTRPGGHVLGCDLLSTTPLRLLHQAEGARFRMMRLSELRDVIAELPADALRLTPSLAGFAVRFTLRRSA